MTMTPSQARIIDPVLSNVAQGYQNAQMVGMALFPYVPVNQRGGKIVQFAKEHFRLYSTARAPGASTKRVEFGYGSSTYALVQHALEGKVPFELMDEANAVPGINLARRSVMGVQDIIALDLEYAQAVLATTLGNYAVANRTTLSGTSQWSDYSGTSDPTTNIETAKEQVRSQIGLRANTVLLSAQAFKACKQHPKILDRIKYTGRDYVTPDLLAALWDVDRVVVGDAVYEDATGALADVWGKHAVVAYTTTAGLADMGTPTYGYTYRLGGFPLVEVPYMDRNQKSWLYPVTDEVAPVIAGASGGYFIQNAVA